jgi:hypothetical protein
MQQCDNALVMLVFLLASRLELAHAHVNRTQSRMAQLAGPFSKSR